MPRKVRTMVVRSASPVLALPSSEELPWLADDLSGALQFNETMVSWWDRVRYSLQFAFEEGLIRPIEVAADEAQSTASTAQEGVDGIGDGLAGTGGGSPTADAITSWEGGTPAIAAHSTRADGGWPGPRIWAWDGGSPYSSYDYALRPDSSMVDDASVVDLIKGTHSGGTP